MILIHHLLCIYSCTFCTKIQISFSASTLCSFNNKLSRPFFMTETKLHALKRIGVFSGDSDVERWLDKVELAITIDGIEESKHASILALNLEGPAYDCWKNLSTEKKKDASAIKNELRAVFGLQRMEAWALAASQRQLESNEKIDVVYEEIKKFVKIATEGNDTVEGVAFCLLLSRFPTHLREKVLLQCGKDMKPSSIVDCAKQLMVKTDSSAIAFAGIQNKVTHADAIHNADAIHRVGVTKLRCYNCNKIGHLMRDCKKTAVSGNWRSGQPRD